MKTAEAPVVRTTVNESSEVDSATERAARLGDLTLSNADGVTFIVNDFGGQRAFQPLQHLLLSRYGVYVIVFDMQKMIVGCDRTHGMTTTEDTVRKQDIRIYVLDGAAIVDKLSLGL
jgi:hypothetical protein